MEYRVNHAGQDVLFTVDDIKDTYLRKCALDSLRKFYGQFSQAKNNEVVLKYRLTDHIDDFFNNDEYAVLSESAKTNRYQVFVTGHGNRFGYEFSNGYLSTIYYQLSSPGRIENNKSKAVSRAFLSNVESQIAAMYSRGFLHGLQLCNLHNKSSFMHACSFAINGRGYVVAATPGAGKSSLLLSMSFAHDLDAEFISDDFACVDEKGNAHYIGRSMAIKSHQIQYFPGLKERIDDMTSMQRLQWFLLKQKCLKRMASPHQIFKEKVTNDIPVKKAIYLTNHNRNSYEHEPMSAEVFADLNANMLFSELYLGMEIVNHSLFLPAKHLLPTADKFIADTRANLSEIFQSIPCELVKVPFHSDPRLLLEYLRKENILE